MIEGTTRKLDDVPAAELVEIARAGHLWLNGFSCINPTPEFLATGLGISNIAILTVNIS